MVYIKPGNAALNVSLVAFLSMVLFFLMFFFNYYQIVLMTLLFFASPLALILGTILCIKDLFTGNSKVFPAIGLVLDVLTAIGWVLYFVIMLRIG